MTAPPPRVPPPTSRRHGQPHAPAAARQQACLPADRRSQRWPSLAPPRRRRRLDECNERSRRQPWPSNPTQPDATHIGLGMALTRRCLSLWRRDWASSGPTPAPASRFGGLPVLLSLDDSAPSSREPTNPSTSIPRDPAAAAMLASRARVRHEARIWPPLVF